MHCLIDEIAQALLIFLHAERFIRPEGTVDIDGFLRAAEKFPLAESGGITEHRLTRFGGITERYIPERADFRIIRPDMRFGINHHAMFFLGVGKHCGMEIPHAVPVGRQRNAAEQFHQFTGDGDGNRVGIHENIGFLWKGNEGGSKSVVDGRSVIGVEKISVFAIFFQEFAVYDFFPTYKFFIQKDDGRGDNAVKQKTKDAP